MAKHSWLGQKMTILKGEELRELEQRLGLVPLPNGEAYEITLRADGSGYDWRVVSC